jgi:hypothetical protein
LVQPNKTTTFKVEQMYDSGGNKIDIAHSGGKDVLIGLPNIPAKYSLIRKIVQKSINLPA